VCLISYIGGVISNVILIFQNLDVASVPGVQALASSALVQKSLQLRDTKCSQEDTVLLFSPHFLLDVLFTFSYISSTVFSSYPGKHSYVTMLFTLRALSFLKRICGHVEDTFKAQIAFTYSLMVCCCEFSQGAFLDSACEAVAVA